MAKRKSDEGGATPAEVALSRRAARAMQTPALRNLDPADRDGFVDAVSRAPSYAALPGFAKDLIKKAEAEIAAYQKGQGADKK